MRSSCIAALTCATLCVSVSVSCGGGGDSRGVTDVQPRVLSLTVNAVASPTNQPSANISGTTEAGATVRVTGGAAPATVDAAAGGAFSVGVQLNRNQTNSLGVKATNAAGDTSRTVTRSVAHDDQPPAAPSLDPFQAFTNQSQIVVTGTTEANAAVSVTSPAGTASGTADSQGGFSVTVALQANSLNALSVTATDAAGNTSAASTNSITHDGIPPNVTFSAPVAGGATGGQSGFAVELAFSDGGSGVDPASFSITSDRGVGGVFLRSGRTTQAYAPGSDLAALFQTVSATAASFAVPDTAAFTPGITTLTPTVADQAGNVSASAQRSFSVTADPDAFIVVDSRGPPGQSAVAVDIGLRNAGEVAGVQFDLAFDAAAVASIDAVTLVDRGTVLDDGAFILVSPLVARVIIFDQQGGAVSAGQGPVLRFSVTLSASAAAGAYAVNLSNAVVSNAAGASGSMPSDAGVLTVE